jgi:hypothetical protein
MSGFDSDDELLQAKLGEDLWKKKSSGQDCLSTVRYLSA